MDNIWEKYLEALRECTAAVKLAALKTQEAAQYADESAKYVRLSVYHIKEYLKTLKEGEKEDYV